MKTISAHFKGSSKTYTFNTELDVKSGDKIRSDQYKDATIVVANPDLGEYEYVDVISGELSNEKAISNVKLRVLTGKIE